MRKPFWTYLACCIAVFMIAMDNLIVTNALPVIRPALHTGLEGLEWTVNAYTMTFAVLLLTGAALGDRFGRRRLMVIGLTVFTAGSAASALAPSIGALIAASGPSNALRQVGTVLGVAVLEYHDQLGSGHYQARVAQTLLRWGGRDPAPAMCGWITNGASPQPVESCRWLGLSEVAPAGAWR